MNKHKYKVLSIALVVLLAGFATACLDDLNTSPIDNDVVTSNSVYNTPEDYKQVLAKLYAGFATTGQQGPAGNADIQGIDEGFSSYIRQMWVAQELPTDEAVVGWNDPGLPEFNYQAWNASNDFVMAMYSRIFYEIALTNEFIRNAQGNNNEEIQEYNAEARFLRALSYWHALDLYGGNVPFVTEDNGVGAYLPEQTNGQELFEYIENELLAIESELPAPQQNEYGRANRAAAWTLLIKLYLNAEVYTGEAHYTEAITYANQVIQAGYTLDDNYGDLFLADNNTANGIIFPIVFDGVNLTTYGGTNFIAHAQVGGSMNPDNFGLDGGWGGHRVTPQFVDKFPDSGDSRAMFYTDGQSKEIETLPEFTNGYAVTKWKNITSSGQPGSNPEFADIDFPMFRLADVYLMYAEAVLRGGDGGSMAQAVEYVNLVRRRAYSDGSGDVSTSQLNLQFILDERARELYWEGHRRTDLIRYEQFTGDTYIWSWKGGTQEGTGTQEHYNVYPLPSSDVNSNPNLNQNEGY